MGQFQWTFGDHLGTIRDSLTISGSSTHYVYSTFGQLLTGSALTFGYTGRETDSDTLLADNWMYYRARYYDAHTGRFVSQDPIGFNAGDANLYRYVGNGPVDATDPSGLQELPPANRPDDGGPPIAEFLAPGIRQQHNDHRKSAVARGTTVFLPELPLYQQPESTRAHFDYPVDPQGNCWMSGPTVDAKGNPVMPPPPVYNPGNGGTIVYIVANEGHVYIIIETPDGHVHSYGAHPSGMHLGNVAIDSDLGHPGAAVSFIGYVLTSDQENRLANWINKPWDYDTNSLLYLSGRRVCIDYAEDSMNFVLNNGWPQTTYVRTVIRENESRKAIRRTVVGIKGHGPLGSPHAVPMPKQDHPYNPGGGGTSD